MPCDACEMLSINGHACHETGCPDAWKSYETPCWECGCDFRPTERPTRYSVCPDCIADAEQREQDHADEQAETEEAAQLAEMELDG